jgi:thioredoxin
MKRIKPIFSLYSLAILIFIAGSCSSSADTDQSAGNEKTATTLDGEQDVKPVYLTAESFRERVWDYEKNPDQWIYEGELPCIVDFYADWCKPCKRVAPIMDDLADVYDGKVLVYKVNTDENRELATVFQVRSIPSILFAPIEGKPAMQPGALSKEDYIRIIDEFVLKVKKQNSDKTTS